MKHKPKINNSDLFELSVCIRFEKNGEFFFILRAEEWTYWISINLSTWSHVKDIFDDDEFFFFPYIAKCHIFC